VDPSGNEFTIGGLVSNMAIGGTIGGAVKTAVAAARGESLDRIGYAFARGLLIGAIFGGLTFGAAAIGINAVAAGAGIGAGEGALEAWMTGGDPVL